MQEKARVNDLVRVRYAGRTYLGTVVKVGTVRRRTGRVDPTMTVRFHTCDGRKVKVRTFFRSAPACGTCGDLPDAQQGPATCPACGRAWE